MADDKEAVVLACTSQHCPESGDIKSSC